MLYLILFLISLVINIGCFILLRQRNNRIEDKNNNINRLLSRVTYFREINKDMRYELEKYKHKK